MNRQAIGPTVFILALTFGIVTASLLADEAVPNPEATREPGFIQPPLQVASAPEFRRLPSFDDYYILRKPHGRLLHPFEGGVYRQSEVVAKDGETWIVLKKDEEQFVLVQSRARVKDLRSISWPGEERDARLSFVGVGDFVFAVNHFNGIKVGRVETVFIMNEVSSESEIATNFDREFDVSGTKYRLRVSDGVTRDGEEAAVLVLESQGKVQVIKQIPKSSPPDRDIFGDLIWAGDVDADGKLDLYLDEFNEKGYTGTELYLSTFADDNTLVDFVASFGAAGC